MDSTPSSDDLDLLYQHVASVLQDHELELDWKTQLERLERRLVERETVSRAKAHLQRTAGLSEEEAYLYLRRISGGTRTRLGDVAGEVLAGTLGRNSRRR